MRMAVPGNGTIVSACCTFGELTLIDLGDAVRYTWNRGRFCIKGFQPVRHGTLDDAIIPDNIKQSYLVRRRGETVRT